ncbi:hypothetical protein JCGZ_05304 [Jatropha curcas]|uniref:DCD domain-containing protein n=1 Tax=Jatropha curcas TaxID=180498 RepID=A0A067JLS3_JATCU|nr:uncharacterized protein LOC105650295 isoform X2 [Jatropha curcas]KDP20459.1 hypothetical protein JCGZ_05304 [Jatropha curcas]
MVPMDEMKGNDACSSMPKTNNGNIEDEMEKEHKMDEMNGGKSGIIGVEIASSEIMKANDEQPFLIPNPSGFESEQFMEEVDMLIGEAEKENMYAEMNNDKIGDIEVEIVSSKFVNVNGEESIFFPCGEENEELTRESNVVIMHEEEEHSMEMLNDEEDPNEDLEYQEEAKEEVNNEEDPDEELEHKEEVKEEVNNEEDPDEELEEEEEARQEVNNKEDLDEELEQEEEVRQEVNNEEQVEVTSKKKVAKSRKKGKKGLKKKITLRSMNKVIVKDTTDQKPSSENNLQMMMELNDNAKIDEKMVHEGNIKEQVKDGERVEDVSQKKIGKLKKKKREDLKKKIARMGVNEVTVKGMNGKEPINKKVKDAKLMGMIFMCSSKTKQDCYRYKVLGLPANKREIVLKICEGMKLFLFDFDLKLLYGIYRAAGPGGYNIEPMAFNSAFPAQVRFSVFEDCLPVPEEKFKKVIKDNYYKKNKFDFQLTSEQVKNLCKLFQAASTKSKQLRRNPKAQTHKFTERDWNKKHHHSAETHTLTADQNRTRKRRKQAEIHASVAWDRSRKRHRQAETHASVDWNRSRKPQKQGKINTSVDRDWTRKRRPAAETHRFSDRDRTRKRHPDAYERETYVSPVAPLPSRPPLPPPSSLAFPPRLYAYEGTSEMMNNYRRDTLTEHQDMRYRDLELRRHKHVEHTRDSFHDHHDGRFLDSELRHQGETKHRDPYPPYRDYPLHRGLSYSVAQPLDYHSHSRTSLHSTAPAYSIDLYDRYGGKRSWY